MVGWPDAAQDHLSADVPYRPARSPRAPRWPAATARSCAAAASPRPGLGAHSHSVWSSNVAVAATRPGPMAPPPPPPHELGRSSAAPPPPGSRPACPHPAPASGGALLAVPASGPAGHSVSTGSGCRTGDLRPLVRHARSAAGRHRIPRRLADDGRQPHLPHRPSELHSGRGDRRAAVHRGWHGGKRRTSPMPSAPHWP